MLDDIGSTKVRETDCTMIWTTLGDADKLSRLLNYLTGGCYWKYMRGQSRIFHTSSSEKSCYATSLLCCRFCCRCCALPLEGAHSKSLTTSSVITTMSALHPPVLSVVLVLWLVLTAFQPPLLVAATSRSVDTFQRTSEATLLNGNREISTPVQDARRTGTGLGAGYSSNASSYVRGRKMLFGPLSCAPQDLSLTQGPVTSTSGIPTFDVQIVNLCGACAMGQIHVACGNWASATPVDPFVFTRLGYNDCLVNNGGPLRSQGSVSFQYSNSAMYPMRISTASNFCR